MNNKAQTEPSTSYTNEQEQEQEKTGQINKKRSKSIRDRLRAIKHRLSRAEEAKPKNENQIEEQTQTTSRLSDRLKRIDFRKSSEVYFPELRPGVHPAEKPKNIPRREENPGEMYKKIEHNMKISRLEEATTLIIALRHLVRTQHPKGKMITFPVPEAVDRIQLKCANLPTNPPELQSLIDEVFRRREETYDLEELYNQHVMAYGRITIDYTVKWPMSHVHTRHP